MISVQKSNGKRIWIIIITAVFAFCALSLAVTKFVYDAIFARYDELAQVPQTLSSMVQTRTQCRFPSGANQLTGYQYHTAAPEQANGLVVLVPGFHAGGDDYLWQISQLLEYNWGVFTFDTTGTLRSQGEGQVGFPQAALDLDAALSYIEENDRFGYGELVLMGHSRGAYAVCCALGEERDIAAAVSVSGVNSAMEAIMQSSVDAVGPVSYANYGFLWLYQAMLFGQDVLNRSASEEISACDVPVLVVHGTEDEDVPANGGAVIAYQEQITSAKVEYLLCEAGHTDLLYDADGTANDALMERIHEFLLRSVEHHTKDRETEGE